MSTLIKFGSYMRGVQQLLLRSRLYSKESGPHDLPSRVMPTAKSRLEPTITKQKTTKPDKNNQKINVTLIQVGKSRVVQLQKRATKLNRKTFDAALATKLSSNNFDKNAAESLAASSSAVQSVHSGRLSHKKHASNDTKENLLQARSFNLDGEILGGKHASDYSNLMTSEDNSSLSELKLDTVFIKSSSKKKKKKSVNSGSTNKNPEAVIKAMNEHGSEPPDPSIKNYKKLTHKSSLDSVKINSKSQTTQQSTSSNISHQSPMNNSHFRPISDNKSKENIKPLNNSEEAGPLLSTASKKKKKRNSVKEKTRDLEEDINGIRNQIRHQKFLNELEGYLSVCVSVGMINRAFNTLDYYRHNKKVPLTSVSIYNRIMFGYYKTGHWLRVSLVKSWLLEAGLSPDATTHALHIASLHRKAVESLTADSHSVLSGDESSSGSLTSRSSSDSLSGLYDDTIASVCSHYGVNTRANVDAMVKERIALVKQEMEDQGMSLDEMFAEADFVYNLSQDTLEGVRRVYPEYTPSPTKILDNPGYTCSLITALNTHHNYGLRGETAHSTDAPPLDRSSPYYVSPETIEEQFALEIQGDAPIPSIYSEAMQNPQSKKALEVLKAQWHQDLLSALTAKIKKMHMRFITMNTDMSMNIFPYFLLLPKEQLVNLMLQELGTLASCSDSNSQSCNFVALRLSRKLYSLYVTRYKTEMGVVDKLKRLYQHYGELYAQHGPSGANTRVLFEQLAHLHHEGPRIDLSLPSWPYSVHIELGRFLYNIMVNNIFVWRDLNNKTHKIPALQEVDVFSGYNNILHIKPHPTLLQLYRQSETLFFFPTEMPMLCPPLPWMSINLGANLLLPVPLVRLPPNVNCSLQIQRLQDVTKCGQLNPCMDSLNLLAQVPWRVNNDILDVIMEVFNSNSGSELDIPQHPSMLQRPTLPSPPPPEEGKDVQRRHNALVTKELQLFNKTKNEMHSLWFTALYKISMANHYRDRVFWLPHNLDFRGRAYPCAPHLCHFESDVFRSMLQFAEAKPLGQAGLDWLKIHVINLTGFKKTENLAERLRYCEEMLPEIFDSAVHPLTGRRWWAKSDEPWQTLVACKELYAALQSPDPLSFESRLPVHQDGSCNGLQHYAALGRDEEGAISVNLSPCETKQDVYSDVARLVEANRKRDAADRSCPNHAIACALKDRIKRKVVKQTVMTTVYGVTQFGARLQIQKQLKDQEGFPSELVKPASNYLTSATFRALETMFVSSKQIQDWFTVCASLISKVCGQSVEWVTPLGLPVIQPYYKASTKHRLVQIGLSIPIRTIHDLQLPNSVKQANAFPPNFIHSLDACHMMLTALHANEAGLTFASVHDCYWTHASTVDLMSKICRDQFVALHSQPILTDLSQFLFDRFGFKPSHFTHDGSKTDSDKVQVNHQLRAVPKLGKFNIDLVKQSTFFFS